MQKRLSLAVFENLKEILKAKNAAHESMFKFSWKKLPPFNLIWPQVDYIRIQRFMGDVRNQALSQKSFIEANRGSSAPEEAEFLDAVPAYVEALANSCDCLARVARFKQELLEKKQKRDLFLFNDILKAYEASQAELVRAGAFVQVAWGTLAGKPLQDGDAEPKAP